MSQKKIFFSLIFLYFSTFSMLTKCLDSLNNQIVKKDLFEIIVVDDYFKTNLDILKNITNYDYFEKNY